MYRLMGGGEKGGLEACTINKKKKSEKKYCKDFQDLFYASVTTGGSKWEDTLSFNPTRKDRT